MATPKKTAAKSSPAKKTAKKPSSRRPAGVTEKRGAKPAPKRAATRGATAKKAAAKKPAAKKPAAKKSAVKKPAVKKLGPIDTGVTVPERRTSLAPSARTPEERRLDASRELAKAVASAGLDKKAERIEIIDVSDKVDYTDFLVLMSGRSDRQVQAIAQGIEAAIVEQGQRSYSTEGMRQGQWVIVDFGDVLVHVFLEEERQHRDLESLWMDARRVPLELDGAAPRA